MDVAEAAFEGGVGGDGVDSGGFEGVVGDLGGGLDGVGAGEADAGAVGDGDDVPALDGFPDGLEGFGEVGVGAAEPGFVAGDVGLGDGVVGQAFLAARGFQEVCGSGDERIGRRYDVKAASSY